MVSNHYHSYFLQVGEIFKVRSARNVVSSNTKDSSSASAGHFVIVDGYVAQNDKKRFCLGALSNVHR